VAVKGGIALHTRRVVLTLNVAGVRRVRNTRSIRSIEGVFSGNAEAKKKKNGHPRACVMVNFRHGLVPFVLISLWVFLDLCFNDSFVSHGIPDYNSPLKLY